MFCFSTLKSALKLALRFHIEETIQPWLLGVTALEARTLGVAKAA